MKTPKKTVLLSAAAACGVGALSAVALAEPVPAVPVAAAKPSADRGWVTPRESFDGPVLDANWFSGRRVVVYLVPDGGLPAVKGPSSAVFRSRWTEGDWSLKYVFVSCVAGKAKFIAGRRVGLYELARQVTVEAGQGDDFVSSNEDYVLQHVFFVHDPQATAWNELLGKLPADCGPAVVLLKDGKIVKTIELDRVGQNSAPGHGQTVEVDEFVAAEVRRSLPSR